MAEKSRHGSVITFNRQTWVKAPLTPIGGIRNDIRPRLLLWSWKVPPGQFQAFIMRMCIALKDLNIGRANKLADADVLIAECTADQVHKFIKF